MSVAATVSEPSVVPAELELVLDQATAAARLEASNDVPDRAGPEYICWSHSTSPGLVSQAWQSMS